MLNLALPTGIGDAAWVLAVLDSVPDRRVYHVPEGQPRRVAPFLELDPRTEAVHYTPAWSTDRVLKEGDWYGAPVGEVLLEARNSMVTLGPPVPFHLNHHLEAGRRIETYLDLPVSERLDFLKNSAQHHRLPGSYAVLYTSSHRTSKAWRGWGAATWGKLAAEILHTGVVEYFVVVGADWDRDLGGDTVCELKARRVPVVDAVGDCPLRRTLDIIAHARFVVGFPSGIPVLSTYLGVKTFMFYPAHLEKMMRAWPSQRDLASGHHICSLFPPSAEDALAQLEEARFV